jgi:hypothetical protein
MGNAIDQTGNTLVAYETCVNVVVVMMMMIIITTTSIMAHEDHNARKCDG